MYKYLWKKKLEEYFWVINVGWYWQLPPEGTNVHTQLNYLVCNCNWWQFSRDFLSLILKQNPIKVWPHMSTDISNLSSLSAAEEDAGDAE